MKKTMSLMALTLMFALLLGACGSLNKQTPAELDDAAIEADVRAKIAERVPEKTFAVEVAVDGGVVTLSGHAATSGQRTEIAKAAQSVNGVTRVINNIHLE
jgi:osmotically-inducible protein OsmY